LRSWHKKTEQNCLLLTTNNNTVVLTNKFDSPSKNTSLITEYAFPYRIHCCISKPVKKAFNRVLHYVLPMGSPLRITYGLHSIWFSYYPTEDNGCKELGSWENASINFSFVNCSDPWDLITNVWNTVSCIRLKWTTLVQKSNTHGNQQYNASLRKQHMVFIRLKFWNDNPEANPARPIC